VYQQNSPNSSSHQRSRQNTTTSINSVPRNSQSLSTPVNNETRHNFFFSNRHQSRLLNNNNNNDPYFSSNTNRSINNCEKFLLDQDLASSSKENDLLLIHSSQSTRFT